MRNKLCSKHIFWFVLIFFSFAAPKANCQNTITLTECFESASKTTALAQEDLLNNEISSLNEKNLSSGWMPSLNLNAAVTYNSDVPDLSNILGSVPVPGLNDAISPVPKDQYKFTIDLNQVIYDGGAIKNSIKLEKSSLLVNLKQTEADIYKLKSQITGFFFGILLLDRQHELLVNYNDLIKKKTEVVRSAVSNGVLTKSDEDLLMSEEISLQQQISENEIKRRSLIRVLESLAGIEITENDRLIMPDPEYQENNELNRPEIDLFELKKDQLTAAEDLVKSRNLPKAFSFASLGYGNPPGNNFFEDRFDTYYIIGAGIKWNIFDWNYSRNEKQKISLQKNLIDLRRQDLVNILERELELKQSEISSIEKLIENDSFLINLKQRITRSAESQYANGIITSSEYLSILNSERQALINSEIHKVSLARARVEYYLIAGKDINKP